MVRDKEKKLMLNQHKFFLYYVSIVVISATMTNVIVTAVAIPITNNNMATNPFYFLFILNLTYKKGSPSSVM